MKKKRNSTEHKDENIWKSGLKLPAANITQIHQGATNFTRKTEISSEEFTNNQVCGKSN